MDPYQTLDVSRDATNQQITRSYRSKASKLHPDKGGDINEFKQLALAYEVLSDAARRDHYDQTGDTELPPDRVVNLLVGLLHHKLLDLLNKGRDPEKADLIRTLDGELVTKCDESREKCAELQKRAKKLQGVRKRLADKKGEDLLGKSLDSAVRELDRAIKMVEQQVSDLEQCRELLKSYRYDRDPTPDEVKTGSWPDGIVMKVKF